MYGHPIIIIHMVNKPTKICSHLSPFKQPIVCYPEARCVTTGKQLSLQH